MKRKKKEKRILNVHIAAQPYVRFRATLQSGQANTQIEFVIRIANGFFLESGEYIAE